MTPANVGGIIGSWSGRDFHVYGNGGIISGQGGNAAGCLAPLGEPFAAHINMVAVDPSGKGNLQAFPKGAGPGSGMTVNYNAIDTNLANAGTVKTQSGTGTDITVYSGVSSAHTVIDVLGYYYSNGDLLYTPVTPCRIVDTRNAGGMISAWSGRDFYVHGSGSTISAQGGNSAGCSSPIGEPLAAHINMVAVDPSGKGNLQAFPKGAAPGAGMTVNYNAIDTNLANAGTVKTSFNTGTDITVYSGKSSAHTVIDVLGYYYYPMLSEAIYSPVTGHWYQLNETRMKWSEAKTFAESQGGYLATITSAAEGQWLYDAFGSALSIDSGYRTFGGNDVASEGQWQWITGETWSYSNWYAGEPNNSGGNEDCIALYSFLKPGHGHSWNDVPTDVGYRSLIEYDSDPN